jgi:hypothetical protein
MISFHEETDEQSGKEVPTGGGRLIQRLFGNPAGDNMAESDYGRLLSFLRSAGHEGLRAAHLRRLAHYRDI